MSVPFVDLKRAEAPLREAILAAIAEVVDSGRYVGGPVVAAFEQRMAELMGVRHAIGVSSGTDALLAALMALGIGPGDEVITTDFTFCAPAEAIRRVGATPVFCDIDPRTFNLDPGAVAAAIGPRTRALLPVHLYGQACDMAALGELAAAHELAIIEDCAQAIGARFDGRPVGSFGDVGCFSFFPTKNLGAMGDGGLVVCQDDVLADEIRLVCRHGTRPKSHQRRIGGNFRLDPIQAAILSVKLDHLGTWTEQRRAIARAYDSALAAAPGVDLPAEADRRRHVYNQYTVRAVDRARLTAALDRAQVGYGIYYDLPLHRQQAYADLGYPAAGCPATGRACAEVVSLPIFPGLSTGEVEAVADALLTSS